MGGTSAALGGTGGYMARELLRCRKELMLGFVSLFAVAAVVVLVSPLLSVASEDEEVVFTAAVWLAVEGGEWVSVSVAFASAVVPVPSSDFVSLDDVYGFQDVYTPDSSGADKTGGV